MPLQSDVTIDAFKFSPDAISEQTKKLNSHLINILQSGPQWYEVGAAKYREMRKRGETPLPAPKTLPQGIDIKIPSRDSDRDIPCRLMYPSSRASPESRKMCKGTVLHFHGGGWVLGDHLSIDPLLQLYADTGDLAVISVGYRLAPEDPYPAGPNDCIDAGEYFSKNSEEEYGGPLRFIGGESAGAHLSLIVTFHLLKAQPSFAPDGLLLHFGNYDFSLLPQANNYRKPLVLNIDLINHFYNAFVPNMTMEQKKDPAVSPYYENLEQFRGRLPSALFTCGTDDALLDDSVNMGTKWMQSGGQAIVKVYPGCPHGFISFPPEMLKEAGEALEDTKTYIQERLAKS